VSLPITAPTTTTTTKPPSSPPFPSPPPLYYYSPFTPIEDASDSLQFELLEYLEGEQEKEVTLRKAIQRIDGVKGDIMRQVRWGWW